MNRRILLIVLSALLLIVPTVYGQDLDVFVDESGVEHEILDFGIGTGDEGATLAVACDVPYYDTSFTCNVSNGFSGVGSGCLCNKWVGSTLYVVFRLDSPVNRSAEACYRPSNEYNPLNFTCSGLHSPAGQFTPQFVGYGLTRGLYTDAWRLW